MAGAVLALNRVYVPHRALKWQRHLLTGLEVAPERLAERLDLLSTRRSAEALEVAGALLAETVLLAEARTDADLRLLPQGVVTAAQGDRSAASCSVMRRPHAHTT